VSFAASLAERVGVGAGAEGQVAAAQGGELGDAQAGLDRGQQQRVVSAPERGAGIGGGEQRGGLGGP
jgi:hypothetical protein